MLNNKTILITGGTGSFGSAFTKYIMEHYTPERIVLFSRDVEKQRFFVQQLEEQFAGYENRLCMIGGSIEDVHALCRACQGVDYVVHTAAMTRVPDAERCPEEAVRANVMGAMNLIAAAKRARVQKVVALSTDMAVNPANVYGGTKLLSDKLFLAANAPAGTCGSKEEDRDVSAAPVFSVVRFGNLAGAAGTVIPFFQKKLDNGERSLPITDYRMTRFWMSMEDGAKLVRKALEEGKGGEIFLSKLPAFKIIDLARAMSFHADLPEMGIRPGEKLSEVMISAEESLSAYEYEDHYVIYPRTEWWEDNRILPGGKKVAPGFVCDSGTTAIRLTVEQIQERLQIPIHHHSRVN